MDFGSVSEADYPLNRAEPRVTILVSGKAGEDEARRRSGSYVDELKTKPTQPGAKSGSRGACSSVG